VTLFGQWEALVLLLFLGFLLPSTSLEGRFGLLHNPGLESLKRISQPLDVGLRDDAGLVVDQRMTLSSTVFQSCSIGVEFRRHKLAGSSQCIPVMTCSSESLFPEPYKNGRKL